MYLLKLSLILQIDLYSVASDNRKNSNTNGYDENRATSLRSVQLVQVN